MIIDRDDLVKVLEALKDTQFELNEPEVNELISGALERKVDKAIAVLEALLA